MLDSCCHFSGLGISKPIHLIVIINTTQDAIREVGGLRKFVGMVTSNDYPSEPFDGNL